MYGMIHGGIKQMVIEKLGRTAWNSIEQDAGIGPQELIAAVVYQDDMTIRLLRSAATQLELTVDETLHAFGRYWIRFAERGSFSTIMTFTGKDIESFISNLDRMHRAVVAALPEARVPSFTIVHRADGLLQVRYRSDRQGLDLFVLGLFEGLLERFDLDGDVRQLDTSAEGITYEVRYRNR